MKILVFESSRQIAERLVTLISETMGDEITFYKAGSYAEAFYFFNECDPDTVLVDLKYPGNCGIRLINAIKAINPEAAIIALSGRDESGIPPWENLAPDFIFDKYAEFEKIPAAINIIHENRLTCEKRKVAQQ